jgi:hypothetical protein
MLWGTDDGRASHDLDGRAPHPPAWAAHTFRGFSTGRFVGNALVVSTTHIKQGWLRRNGTPESDQATVTEFFVRHGDHLTNTTVVTDPVFLSEPQVRSNDYSRVPVDHAAWLYACDDGEQILDRAPDFVPHYLFGKQRMRRSSRRSTNCRWPASVDGAPSMYPGYAATLRSVTDAVAAALFEPAAGKPNETSKVADPDPRDGEIHVLPSASRPTCWSATTATSSCRPASRGCSSSTRVWGHWRTR